jgi:hypothetical protein
MLASRFHSFIGRGASQCHSGFADVVNTLISPKMSLPACVVERLAQNQGDKALSLHSAQRLNQGTEASNTYFGVCAYRFISRTKVAGSTTIMSCMFFPCLRMSSSVVTKYVHSPAIAHAIYGASFAFSPRATSPLAC